MISLIACVDMGMGIADKDGNLLFNLPADLRYFRETTKKKIVVMGRKTWESLPEDKRPLDRRENYVLTRDKDFVAEGAKVIHSIEEILELGKGSKEVFIMGGGELYKQMIPHADKMYLTHVHNINMDARVFFPNFGLEWKALTEIRHKADKKHAHSFTFATYEPNKKYAVETEEEENNQDN
ncbi:dihydrofolate reductase [Bacillus phage vB_BanS_Skywalker]|uniref:dihydrofolate reductase n=1 Tax=Bacillus phage vB_BanS_Skywalker TaxID=2894789 RepID=A0AAE9CEC3_9CAUD|nr:dihydrofolate reductase [Bacillus phage vB_BanS_Skywalker]UGO51254.1 dihydrofolate reductase [Bacillus phage vB_BanS_Skywalker]